MNDTHVFLELRILDFRMYNLILWVALNLLKCRMWPAGRVVGIAAIIPLNVKHVIY